MIRDFFFCSLHRNKAPILSKVVWDSHDGKDVLLPEQNDLRMKKELLLCVSGIRLYLPKFLFSATWKVCFMKAMKR